MVIGLCVAVDRRGRRGGFVGGDIDEVDRVQKSEALRRRLQVRLIRVCARHAWLLTGRNAYREGDRA
jgi:hypothetical protein